MSKRESRLSINRQHDALSEFENFKKKFLLANKHITKLNSTLSVRIEELNAQISTLYVENLRLRASEIALATQLQREREKSWRIMTDTEAATQNLSKHLGHLRKSFNISQSTPSPPQQPPAPPPRTRRPMPDPAATPQTTRLSRPPNVPGIYEDDEEGEVDTSPEDVERLPSPTVRRKMKARLSASRLPLPSRVSSPPPEQSPFVIESKGKKKSNRRQSGLLTVDTARPASPMLGSPIRKLAEAARPTEGDEDEDVAVTDEMSVDAELDAALRREKGKSKERDREADPVVAETQLKEKKRRRDNDEGTSSTSTASTTEGGSKLKDVTNSPRDRSVLPLLDINTSYRERQQTPETEPTTAISSAPSSLTSFPSSESTPATTPAHTSHTLSDSDPSYLPTPRASSSPAPQLDSASETEVASSNAANGGRATRARKSVNYAEPKLNTKMRKPDSEPGTSTGTKKRPSIVKSQSQSQPLAADDPTTRSSIENPPLMKSPSKRKRSTNPQPPSLPADGPEPRSSSETVPAPPHRNHAQLQEIKSRPASVSPPPLAYSQIQALPPRPASRPTSSASTSFRPISSSHAYVTTTPAPNSSSAATTTKRKKSRPYLDPDDYGDSDGAQADAEFGGAGLTNGWVNVGGRRRSVLNGHGVGDSTRERGAGGESLFDGEGRRHSVAV